MPGFSIAAYITRMAGIVPKATRTRGMTLQVIQGALSAGLRSPTGPPSGRETLRLLRWRGFEIRTQDFFAMRRDVVDREGIFAKQVARDPSRLIPNSMVRASTKKLSRQYLYTMSVNMRIQSAGKMQSVFLRHSSDERLTPDVLVDTFKGLHGDKFQPDMIDWASLKFAGVERYSSRAWGTN